MKLPVPIIPGNLMQDTSGIRRLILHFSSEDERKLVTSGDRIKVLGSIWYADWLSETNPLLLIVDEIHFLP